MTTTLKHTHKGTCQACGRAQAFYRGTVAKHGYTVTYGFFNGVCRGAEAKPLEHDKTLTEATIVALGEFAAQCDKRAAALKSGELEPEFYNSHYDRQLCKNVRTVCARHEVKFAHYETQEQVIRQQIDLAIHYAERDARFARADAALLRQLIETRHGQPLIPVVTRKEVKAGSRVRIGGKKGNVYTCVKVDWAVARGCGPYMNGKRLLHAFFESSKTQQLFGVPTQTIRQEAILDEGVAS